MGAGSSLHIGHKSPKHIRHIVKHHIEEKVKPHIVKGSFAFPFVGKNYFYKVNLMKNKGCAIDLLEHINMLKNEYRTRYLCHAVECKLVEDKYLVTKFTLHKGDLFEMKNKLNFAELTKILLDLVSAVSFLHMHGLVHGDIKPENILVSENNFAILCDIDNVGKPTDVRRIGTEFYAPPVGLMREGVNMAMTGRVTWFELYAMVDLYAVGSTVLTALHKKKTRNIHVQRFFDALANMYTKDNITYFFSETCKNRMIRAVDAVPIMTYYNLEPVGMLECDCAQRKEWENGCMFCDTVDDKEEVRLVEKPSDLGV